MIADRQGRDVGACDAAGHAPGTKRRKKLSREPTADAATKSPSTDQAIDSTTGNYREGSQEGLSGRAEQVAFASNPNHGPSRALELRWDVVTYVQQQLSGRWEDLTEVITLTGDTEKAFASTCRDYLLRQWPSTSKLVLKVLARILIAAFDQDISPRHIRLNFQLVGFPSRNAAGRQCVGLC